MSYIIRKISFDLKKDDAMYYDECNPLETCSAQTAICTIEKEVLNTA